MTSLEYLDDEQTAMAALLFTMGYDTQQISNLLDDKYPGQIFTEASVYNSLRRARERDREQVDRRRTVIIAEEISKCRFTTT